MNEIDRRIYLAQVKRETTIKSKKDQGGDYKDKLATIKSNKEALANQREYETMNKVILKHHEKVQKMTKKAKEDKILQLYNQEKAHEQED